LLPLNQRKTAFMSDSNTKFTSYQVFVMIALAAMQFLIILDFMVLSPLGAVLMPALDINPQQFGFVVSAYAFSAGISGLLAAGFADSFDRKKLLLFFLSGFLLGTLLCGIANSYVFLLLARIVTGIFGGVVGSIAFAIITDLFEVEKRGRVMGTVQMSFAVSQVLGLPIGLYLANAWDWHAPFLLIVGLGVLVFVLIMLQMRPVTAHLALQKENSAFQHLWKTLSTPFYLRAFTATTLLATGGFMLMPFGSAYAVNNLGITMNDLPTIYLVTGICSMIAGPLIGRYTDKLGSVFIFTAGSMLSMVLVLIYCNLGTTPLWVLIVMNSVLFVGLTARMISSSALSSKVPVPADRGAFMGINSSIAQISGGIAASIAGMIIHESPSGALENYPLLGIVVAISMMVCVWLIWRIGSALKVRDAVNG
jgi:predicted MFS family arabinose efflux permease